ncbi:hypothetical protein F0562_013739 [Nyssa sinensis]|uniref:Uncharacterized protein n=1 Tax=Nyssa sinensis TaxID=561372 RepID=A0A5J4ZKW9_9ASTE|nr:hypothetical protein F0562_013739 [Nyssa sinensis]
MIYLALFPIYVPCRNGAVHHASPATGTPSPVSLFSPAHIVFREIYALALGMDCSFYLHKDQGMFYHCQLSLT